MTTKTNLTIMQGETWTQAFTWLDASEDPIDLTTYAARMQARRAYADIDRTDPVIDLSDGQGIELDDEGNIILTLSDEETSAISAGEYVFDLELDNGEVTKLVAGKLNVFPEVTR